MKYTVERLKVGTSKVIWEEDSDFKTYDEARSKCIQICGGENVYTEPSVELEGASAYFGKKDESLWICRIVIKRRDYKK